MEGSRRRSFTDDYKRQAVDLVASSGRSIGSIAKELGLRDSVLRRWVEQRGARLEPTAAARRPTTQATLPSAAKIDCVVSTINSKRSAPAASSRQYSNASQADESAATCSGEVTFGSVTTKL